MFESRASNIAQTDTQRFFCEYIALLHNRCEMAITLAIDSTEPMLASCGPTASNPAPSPVHAFVDELLSIEQGQARLFSRVCNTRATKCPLLRPRRLWRPLVINNLFVFNSTGKFNSRRLQATCLFSVSYMKISGLSPLISILKNQKFCVNLPGCCRAPLRAGKLVWEYFRIACEPVVIHKKNQRGPLFGGKPSSDSAIAGRSKMQHHPSLIWRESWSTFQAK